MNGRLLNKKLHNQLGFTLLELLVVIAVIGVLASLAVPRLQSQVQKARFLDVINSTSTYKSGVELCAQRNNALATCITGAGADLNMPAANLIVNTNVNSQSVALDGTNVVITATGTTASSNGAAALTYTLTGTLNAGNLTWATGGTCAAQGFCNN